MNKGQPQDAPAEAKPASNMENMCEYRQQQHQDRSDLAFFHTV